MDDIKKRIKELGNELVELRRDFHMHPELGFKEFRTAEKIEAYLQSLGFETTRVAKTGVVTLLKGPEPGPVLMLRADMDALPVEEKNTMDYKSQNPGVMHACGHDAHMAMLLVAAKVLKENRDRLKGTIKFVFQPDEEIAGALAMLDQGVLENPKVDAVMAIHAWTPLESGKIAISKGTVMAGLDVFKIIVRGKGGHTGAPQYAVDPIIAAAGIIQTVQTVQTREIDALKPTVIMFGKIHGGTKTNIIPEKVELEGSIRFLYDAGPKTDAHPTQKFIRMVKRVCDTYRCTCDIEIIPENKPLVNNDDMVRMARQTAQKVFTDPRSIVDGHYNASEDFSEFSSKVPGVFMFLGTGNKEKNSDVPHHNPCFNIDEDTLPVGVEMFVRGAFDFGDQKEVVTA